MLDRHRRFNGRPGGLLGICEGSLVIIKDIAVFLKAVRFPAATMAISFELEWLACQLPTALWALTKGVGTREDVRQCVLRRSDGVSYGKPTLNWDPPEVYPLLPDNHIALLANVDEERSSR